MNEQLAFSRILAEVIERKRAVVVEAEVLNERAVVWSLVLPGPKPCPVITPSP